MLADRDAIRRLILEAKDRRNYSVREVARAAQLSPAVVDKAINRRAVPSPESCRKLAPVLGVPVDTLLELAGHKTATSNRPPSRDELLERFLAVDAIEVPFYDVTASASPGRSFLNDAPVDYGYLPARGRYRKGRIKGLTIRGDCLAPRVNDGDRVFIDTQADYVGGDLVLAAVEEALHLKRLRPLGEGWELTPDNGEPPIPVAEGVVLLGRFIGLWRQGI